MNAPTSTPPDDVTQRIARRQRGGTMSLSRESLLALQRHFLGALSAPSRTWLEPLPLARLAYVGSIVHRGPGGCVLDFGTVASPGKEHHAIRISHRGPEHVEVRIAGTPPWLKARWRDAGGDRITLQFGTPAAMLDLTIAHDSDDDFRGSLRLAIDDGVTERVDEIPLRMTARRVYPLAVLDFNGSPHPQPHDFGENDTPYVLTVRSATSIPLLVRCADLPDWLLFEVDGRKRGGPLRGRFFERSSPLTIHLRPQFLGRHKGSLRIQTDDPRPEWQSIQLPLASSLTSARPCVRAVAPARTRIYRRQMLVVVARLENFGREAARVSLPSALPQALQMADALIVPAAHDGHPGVMSFGVRIIASQLEAGRHALPVTIAVAGGVPAAVTMAIEVDVSRSVHSTELKTALFVLFVLALLFIFIAGGTQ